MCGEVWTLHDPCRATQGCSTENRFSELQRYLCWCNWCIQPWRVSACHQPWAWNGWWSVYTPIHVVGGLNIVITSQIRQYLHQPCNTIQVYWHIQCIFSRRLQTCREEVHSIGMELHKHRVLIQFCLLLLTESDIRKFVKFYSFATTLVWVHWYEFISCDYW